MERACSVAVVNGQQIVVTLSYYLDAKTQSAWLSRDLPPYDLADATTSADAIVNDIKTADRRAIAAYKRSSEIASALAGLAQRQSV